MSCPSHARRKGVLLGVLAVLFATSLVGCSQTKTLDRSTVPPREAERLDEDAPYLKAHMDNGDVYVLSDWSVQQGEHVVQGHGRHLSPHREVLDTGAMRVPIDRVALFETNETDTSLSLVAMSIVTGASLALTAACVSDPKSCFGSCPTFYTGADADTVLRAEGFSSSIAPSLEATDVDALYPMETTEASVQLQMRNEALETHVVRTANLLAVPRSTDGQAFRATDGTFWSAEALQSPTKCVAPEGDCRSLVANMDGRERYSRADSTDLATKETITLEFDVPDNGPLGLVVGARQTLLTTFLLYQTLAYMGEDVGSWLADLERNASAIRNTDVVDVLGKIEVWVPTENGDWTKVGEVGEHGPLATDVQLVPLPDLPASARSVQLRLTKGNWRLDYLALATLADRVEPVRVPPTAVTQNGDPAPEARAQLLDSTRTLVTLPGASYTLSYDLPGDPASHELFLESRGYYLEWMREQWMEETNPDRVADMLTAPEEMMKTLAPRFKAVEPEMERAFWNSRYER